MEQTVTAIGIIVGLMMIATVCIVYYKHQTFGLGGSTLALLGTILIGMSVWSNIKVSVGANGGFSAELTQIQQNIAQINNRNEQIVKSVS